MFPVEYLRLQRKGIHAVDAAEVGAEVANLARGLVEGVDAAVLAEVMLRRPGAELVQPQRTVLRIDLEQLWWNRLGRHHRALARADGAVAAQALGDRRAVEGELYFAAVAGGGVVGHGEVLFSFDLIFEFRYAPSGGALQRIVG